MPSHEQGDDVLNIIYDASNVTRNFPSIVRFLGIFIDAARAGKGDPKGTCERIFQSYQGMKYALRENELGTETKADPKFDDADWRTRDHRRSNDKLDAILADAINNGDRERGEREEMEALKPALKQLMPDKSFSEALDVIVKLDADLRTDPAKGSQTLYQMFGGAEQQQYVAELDHLSNVVDAMAPHLPGIERGDVQEKVTHVLTRPDFVRTSDPAADLARAHAVVAHLDRQHQELGNWAQGEISKMPPDLARAVEHTLLHDPSYKARAAANIASRPFGDSVAPQINMGIATGIAQEKLARLAKAKKAGRVKTSTGSNPRGGSSSGSGLDRAIADAMRS